MKERHRELFILIFRSYGKMADDAHNRIPKLDFSRREENDFSARLVEVFHTVGFVYLENHGVEKNLVRQQL